MIILQSFLGRSVFKITDLEDIKVDHTYCFKQSQVGQSDETTLAYSANCHGI